MKVQYHGKSSPIYFIDDKTYKVIGKQCGFWSIVDESGSNYLYGPSECFEIVSGSPEELEEIPMGYS